LVKQITQQKAESDRLRLELRQATEAIVDENARISTRMTAVLEEEKKQAANDRQNLLSQITALVNAQAETQEKRLSEKSAMVQESITSSNATLESTLKAYEDGMDSWNEKETELLDKVAKSKDTMKTKLQDDWAVSILTLKMAPHQRLTLARRRMCTAPRSRTRQSRSTRRPCASWTSSSRALRCRWKPSMSL
jgi:kinesin family protein 11